MTSATIISQDRGNRSHSSTGKAGAGAQGQRGEESRESHFFNGPKKTKEFKKKEQVDMFRGLGSMLRAQINTADALKYYGQGLPNKSMVDCLASVRENINTGMNVHEAFRRTKRFNETIIGSDTGRL